jgi:hypothetical protein
MTILGTSGTLHFQRHPPSSFAITALDWRPHSRTYQPGNFSLQTGDSVKVKHVTDNSTSSYFVFVDFLNRIGFYKNRLECLSGNVEDRLEITETEVKVFLQSKDSSIDVNIDEWILHLDAAYLDEVLVTRKLGEGALTLCTGGGQISFSIILENPGEQFSKLELITKTLSSLTPLNAKLSFGSNLEIHQKYILKIQPLSFVLNTQELPLLDGTLNFATTGPINLRTI